MEPHTRVSVYEGRHYAFCCGGCAQNFDADPAFYVNRLNEALRKQ
ncbi:MAG: YHS domain-containing protein [Myxococcales bacterium]|nr:YHS domain-containing protein [Myxococcales bacterium]